MKNGLIALFIVFVVYSVCGWLPATKATDIVVTNVSEFSAALDTASDGDRILLAPGNYAGGFFKSGLTGVTIRSQFANNPAVIVGGTNAIQLSDATRVVIEHLVCTGQTGNGLNIDDGGSFATPSTDVAIREVIVQDMNANGNNDGIKLSGVTGFMIEQVQVINWGEGGSAVDTVGSHHGLIQNSLFRHDALGPVGSGVRPKGGSKAIIIRANRFELPGSNGRAIQAGGSTDTQFFRFIDGDSGYEADEIRAEGNVVVNGSAAFSFVNIDGGHFHHNYAHRPGDWFIRILNENSGTAIVDTQNGILNDNVMVFNDTASEFNRAVNEGSETLPETFLFMRNQWYNIADPMNSQPSLPSTEIGGVYGVPPAFAIDKAIGWQFDWGQWIVNANGLPKSYSVANPSQWLKVERGTNNSFDPLDANPFSGEWTITALTGNSIVVPPFSQAFLIPDSFRLAAQGQKRLDGDVVAGQLSDLVETDGVFQVLDPPPTTNPFKQKVEVIFLSESIQLDPSSFDFRISSRMVGGPSSDVVLDIQLFNFQTASWDLVDSRAASNEVELTQIDPGGDLTRFIHPVHGEVLARVAWASESFSGTPFDWVIEIDEATWLVFD